METSISVRPASWGICFTWTCPTPPMSLTIHWTDHLTGIMRRAADPPRLLVACDFDGTLAPIVPTPAEAALLPGMEEVLRSLSTAPGVHLAFVSGRPLEDLKKRVPIAAAGFIGSHGLEMQGHVLDGVPGAAAAWRGRFPFIADAIRRRTEQLPGVFVKEKPLSVAVHYRHACSADAAAVQALLQDTVNGAREFRLQEGHMVTELLPAIGRDKGTALCALADRLGVPRSADSPADLLQLLQHVDAARRKTCGKDPAEVKVRLAAARPALSPHCKGAQRCG